jgi:hypothetical protein
MPNKSELDDGIERGFCVLSCFVLKSKVPALIITVTGRDKRNLKKMAGWIPNLKE